MEGERLKVIHYHRKPLPGNFSVENLFRDVRNAFTSEVDVTVVTLPCVSKGISNRLKNLWSISTTSGHINHITGDVTYIACRMESRRTICTFLDCVNLDRLTGLRRWILKKLWFDLPIQRSALITVISAATGKRLVELVGCPPEKIRVVHVPISDGYMASPKPFNGEKPTILHVGTKHNKNLERHIAALKGLNCRMLIVGELSNSQKVLLKENNIDYTNRFRLSSTEIVRQYKEADILLFASTYEGFGMPIVEANAVGRPVITGNLLSMPEVAGDAAVLVDPFDVESIRTAVLRVINEPELRERLVDSGYKNAKRFEANKIAKQFTEIYREVALNAGLVNGE